MRLKCGESGFVGPCSWAKNESADMLPGKRYVEEYVCARNLESAGSHPYHAAGNWRVGCSWRRRKRARTSRHVADLLGGGWRSHRNGGKQNEGGKCVSGIRGDAKGPTCVTCGGTEHTTRDCPGNRSKKHVNSLNELVPGSHSEPAFATILPTTSSGKDKKFAYTVLVFHVHPEIGTDVSIDSGAALSVMLK